MRPLNTALLHWNGPICITRANIYIIHQYTPTNQYTSYTLPPTNPRTNIHQTYLEDGEGFMWHTMCRSCHLHFFVRAFILYLMGEQQKESQILMFKLSREKNPIKLMCIFSIHVGHIRDSCEQKFIPP